MSDQVPLNVVIFEFDELITLSGWRVEEGHLTSAGSDGYKENIYMRANLVTGAFLEQFAQVNSLSG